MRDPGVGKWMREDGVFGKSVAMQNDNTGKRAAVRVVKRCPPKDRAR